MIADKFWSTFSKANIKFAKFTELGNVTTRCHYLMFNSNITVQFSRIMIYYSVEPFNIQIIFVLRENWVLFDY